jgi:heme oxygenase
MHPIIDGVLRRLAHATADSERAMKQHPLQRDLTRGLLPRSSYVNWLTQLFFVHRTLEWHLGRLRAVVPPLAAVVRDHYFHTPALASDLSCFAVDLQRVTRLAPTHVLVDLIDGLAVRAPLSLVGFAYVLEEGKNGGRQIAMRARLAYRLQPSLGVAYLDPYGDKQRQRWLEFKGDMESVGFEPEEIHVMADAARRTHQSLIAIMDAIVMGEMADARRRPAT